MSEDTVPYGGRTLLDKRNVPDVQGCVINLGIKTHCPAKWAFVDMETGQVWVADRLDYEGFQDASDDEKHCVVLAALLSLGLHKHGL